MIHVDSTLVWYTNNDDIYYYVHDRGYKMSHVRLGGSNFKIVAVNIINDLHDYMLVNSVDSVTVNMGHFKSVMTIKKVKDSIVYTRLVDLTEENYKRLGIEVTIKGRYGNGFRGKWYRFWFLSKC